MTRLGMHGHGTATTRNGRWLTAAVLAGAASSVRLNGLFLLAALATAAVLHPGGWAGEASTGRPWARATGPGAGRPAARADPAGRVRGAPVGAHRGLAGLAACRGKRLAPQLTSPVDAFRNTWEAGFDHGYAEASGHQTYLIATYLDQLEIVAVAAGLITVIVLAVRRRWPETVYTGLAIGVLATSTLYESVPRALLLLWPVWCGPALAAARRPWVGQLYLAVSVPVAVAIGYLFAAGNWAG